MLKDVIINDEKWLEGLKAKFKAGGVENLHVLSDFDRTLICAFVEGRNVPSLISILRDGDYINSGYRKKAHELYNKYHPIEIDPLIPLQEKKKAMKEWWTTHFELLIECGLERQDVKRVVETGWVKLRQGAFEFFELVYKNNVPLVIMSSSGLGGESIKLFLKKQGCFYPNIYLVSNDFEWDENGKAIKVKKPIIYQFNKDETVVKDFPFFEKIKNRKNVLLLGDSIGDVDMIIGFDYDNLIKIGFLNEAVEQNLSEYQKNFDVVLLNDASFDFINDLLKNMID